MAEIDFGKPNDLISYINWINDTEQIKEAQDVFETAEEGIKRELYFKLAVLEIAKILDEYDKLNASLSRMSDYLIRYGLPEPEVYEKILACRVSISKSNVCFIEVANKLYNISIEKEKINGKNPSTIG